MLMGREPEARAARLATIRSVHIVRSVAGIPGAYQLPCMATCLSQMHPTSLSVDSMSDHWGQPSHYFNMMSVRGWDLQHLSIDIMDDSGSWRELAILSSPTLKTLSVLAGQYPVEDKPDTASLSFPVLSKIRYDYYGYIVRHLSSFIPNVISGAPKLRTMEFARRAYFHLESLLSHSEDKVQVVILDPENGLSSALDRLNFEEARRIARACPSISIVRCTGLRDEVVTDAQNLNICFPHLQRLEFDNLSIDALYSMVQELDNVTYLHRLRVLCAAVRPTVDPDSDILQKVYVSTLRTICGKRGINLVVRQFAHKATSR